MKRTWEGFAGVWRHERRSRAAGLEESADPAEAEAQRASSRSGLERVVQGAEARAQQHRQPRQVLHRLALHGC